MKKIFFPRRIPEPAEMGKKELKVFETLSLASQKKWIVPLLLRISKYSPESTEKILDVACGPGIFCKALAKKYPRSKIYACDISPHAVKMAKKNCEDLKNVYFTVSSIYNLPYPRENFDLVVCKDSLHHFNRVDKALRETVRVTRPGGKIVIQDLRRDLPYYLLKKAVPPNTPIKKLQYFSARAAYLKTELVQILKKNKINKFKISVPKITKQFARMLKKYKIRPEEVRESWQTRFFAVINKN